MDKYIVNGGKKLHGEVSVSGSKNAALPILTASLLTDERCVIKNVPHLRDIDTMCALLSVLGRNVTRKDNEVIIQQGRIKRASAPYELVKKMRASVLVMGPLLARTNKVKVSLPGGCAIGIRPIQFHLSGFMEMGCTVSMERGYVILKTSGLKGKRIVLDFPSVGATENLLMGAVLARGKTIIENAAQEPEIVDLVRFLCRMGARIYGEGTRMVVVQGVTALSGTEYTVMPDRIEAATLLIAAAMTRGRVRIVQVDADHCTSVIEKMRESGVRITVDGSTITVETPGTISAVSVETAPYPGFPTDLQALWVALMSTAKGVSIITETIFEKRFIHVSELNRMGLKARIQGNSVLVEGVPYLSGAPVMASDLRAGAALVIAGLGAKNKTEISRIYHVDRGYERFENKLRALGARIRRLK